MSIASFGVQPTHPHGSMGKFLWLSHEKPAGWQKSMLEHLHHCIEHQPGHPQTKGVIQGVLQHLLDIVDGCPPSDYQNLSSKITQACIRTHPPLLLDWLSSSEWPRASLPRVNASLYKILLSQEHPTINQYVQNTLSQEELGRLLYHAHLEQSSLFSKTAFGFSVDLFLQWAEEKPHAWWTQALNPKLSPSLHHTVIASSFPQWKALLEKHALLHAIEPALDILDPTHPPSVSSKRKI